MPSHYLNQCRRIINWTSVNNSQLNLIKLQQFLYNKNQIGNFAEKWCHFFQASIVKYIYISDNGWVIKMYVDYPCDMLSILGWSQPPELNPITHQEICHSPLQQTKCSPFVLDWTSNFKTFWQPWHFDNNSHGSLYYSWNLYHMLVVAIYHHAD